MKSRKGPERNKPSAPAPASASQGETRQAALEKYRMWLDESSSTSSNGDSDANANSSSDESELKEASAESNGSEHDVANTGTFGSGAQPETKLPRPITQQPRSQQSVLQEDDDDVVHPVSPSHPPTYRTRSVTGIGRPAEDRHRPGMNGGNSGQQHQRQKQKQPGNTSGGNVGRQRAAQNNTADVDRPALASAAAVSRAERQSPATRILHTPRKLMRQMLSPSPSPSPSPLPFPSSPSLCGASRPARQNMNQMQSQSRARHHRRSRSDTSNMTRVGEPAGLYGGRADELDARGMGSLFGDAWIARPQTATTRQGTREEGADDQQRVPRAAPVCSIPSRGSTLYDVSLENGSDDKRQQQYKGSPEGRSDIRRASTGADVWEYYRPDSMQAWRVAVCALLAALASLSTVLSYCVYQEYYLAANAETATLRPNEGLHMPPSQAGAAAADGSVLAGVHAGTSDLLATGREPSRHVVVLAALVGALMCASAAAFALPAALAAEAVGMRAPAAAGTVLMAAGLFSASFIPRLQGLCVMQGAVCGAGVAFVLVPAYSAAPMWFDKHRALASG
ncbi:hypothetical protein GGI11_006552, partial [Coemansia sp. RSA 2049]